MEGHDRTEDEAARKGDRGADQAAVHTADARRREAQDALGAQEAAEDLEAPDGLADRTGHKARVARAGRRGRS
ncbi:hypothetical protein GCM10010208_56740 [Actinomadura livida]|nr:hypothetical protein GCM10010208_56740 [Actinomadura livida]